MILPFLARSARSPLPSPVLPLIPSDRKAFRDVQMALFDTSISRHSQRLLEIDEIQQLPKLYYYKVAAELNQVFFNGGSTLYTRGVGSVKVMVIESGAVDIVVPPTLHALFARFKDFLTARDPLNEDGVKVVDPLTLGTLPPVLLSALGLVLPPDPAASYPLLPEGDNQTKQKKLSIANPQVKAVEAQPQPRTPRQSLPVTQPQAQAQPEAPAINPAKPSTIRPLETIEDKSAERPDSPGLSDALDRSNLSAQEPSPLIQATTGKLSTGVPNKSTDPAVRQSKSLAPSPSQSPPPLLTSQSRAQSTRSLNAHQQVTPSAATTKERSAPRGVQPSHGAPIAPRPMRPAMTVPVDTNDDDEDKDEDEDEEDDEFDSRPSNLQASSNKQAPSRPSSKSPVLPVISSASHGSATSHSNGGGTGGGSTHKSGQQAAPVSGKAGGGSVRAPAVKGSGEKGAGANATASKTASTTSANSQKSKRLPAPSAQAPSRNSSRNGRNSDDEETKTVSAARNNRQDGGGYSLFLKLVQSQAPSVASSPGESAANSRASSPHAESRPAPSAASGTNARPLSPITREKMALEASMDSDEDSDSGGNARTPPASSQPHRTAPTGSGGAEPRRRSQIGDFFRTAPAATGTNGSGDAPRRKSQIGGAIPVRRYRNYSHGLVTC